MTSASDPGVSGTDRWTLRESLCFLAFGSPEKPIVPLSPRDDPEIEWDIDVARRWVENRGANEAAIYLSAQRLAAALNTGEIEAYGRRVANGDWSATIAGAGSVPARTALISRTSERLELLSANDLKFCIDTIVDLSGHPGRPSPGIPLVLKEAAANEYSNMVEMYVYVQISTEQVRALDGQIKSGILRGTQEKESPRSPGRPGVTGKIVSIFTELLEGGKVANDHLLAAPIVHRALATDRSINTPTLNTVKKRLKEHLAHSKCGG